MLLDRVRSGQVGVPGFQLRQIDRPALPTSPIYPNTKLTYAVAALIGLGLGIAAALLWETLGKRVRTRSDLADAAGVPIFAEVALAPPVRQVRSLASFGTDPELRTVSEALRDLRTNLVFADDRLGSIVVTSPEGRHGKTTVAAGLAATMARSGTRTILVDADMHRGRVATMLRMPHAPGLREALEGGDPAQASAPRRSRTSTCSRPAASEAIPASCSRRASGRWSSRLEQEYDVVVIDAPPLAPVNDARVIARLAKATLLVCAAGKASHRSVRDAVERLALIGVTPTAGILNMSRSRQARGYYGPPADAVPAAPVDGEQFEAEPPKVESRRAPSS